VYAIVAGPPPGTRLNSRGAVDSSSAALAAIPGPFPQRQISLRFSRHCGSPSPAASVAAGGPTARYAIRYPTKTSSLRQELPSNCQKHQLERKKGHSQKGWLNRHYRCHFSREVRDWSVRPFPSYRDSRCTTLRGTLHDQTAGITGAFYDVNSGMAYGINSVGNNCRCPGPKCRTSGERLKS